MWTDDFLVIFRVLLIAMLGMAVCKGRTHTPTL
ncbi:hypothetical protein LMG19083_04598 [Ralstonia psammae]|uniref:Uncharacterized protein n=1 Tax=Ralstonia psammae TaxID=3058598 RepID=A0ABM9JYG4_9RALS|nr:hypothetical protein LMG19083_04598 [Ralstonia sp. LMG 19083]